MDTVWYNFQSAFQRVLEEDVLEEDVLEEDALQVAYDHFHKICMFVYENNRDHEGNELLQVFTHRPVLRCFHDDGNTPVYKVVGTVKTFLCMLPILEVTKYTRQRLESLVLGHAMQWCMALLDEHSTIEDGPVTLVNLNMNRRHVQDSLHDEMMRMKILPATSGYFFPIHSFPGIDGLDNRSECSVSWFTSSWGLVFDRHATQYGAVDIFLGAFSVPGQALNLPFYLTFGAKEFSRVLNDISILWARSFHAHKSYVRFADVPDNLCWRKL